MEKITKIHNIKLLLFIALMALVNISYSQNPIKARPDQMIMVDSVQEIQNVKVRLGDRIKVKSTGAEYLVQTDSVPGYITDEVAVITVGGNYAVLQATEKGYNALHFGFSSNNSPENNHLSLQKAIDWHKASGTPTTIYMQEGLFRVGSANADAVDNELWNIEQTQDLTIEGQGKDKTIILGERDHIAESTASRFFRLRNAPNVTMQDFTLRSEFQRSVNMRAADPENSPDSSMVFGVVVVTKSSGGNNLNSDNLKLKRLGFKYNYGVQVFNNDNTKGFEMSECEIEDILYDSQSGSIQPTGVLINNSRDFIIENNKFYDVIDLTDNLAHCIYVGFGCDNGKIIGNTARITYPEKQVWVEGESGSNGLKFGSGVNTNMEVSLNTIDYGGNYIQDLQNSNIHDNYFSNGQVELLNGCENVKLNNNIFVRERDGAAYDGLLEIGSGTVKSVEIYDNTFSTVDTLSDDFLYGIGISSRGGKLKNSIIKGNVFKNTGRAIWFGYSTGTDGVDSCTIECNRFEMLSKGREFVYNNTGAVNRIQYNELIQGIFSTPRFYRDNDDGDPSDELGNILVDNRLVGSYSEPYGLNTNGIVYNVGFLDIDTLQTQAQQFESNYQFTPFAYTGLDILPVDTLLSQRFVVTGALDGKTITGVEYTLDNQVTTDSTLVRLLKYTPSTNTYTSFGNASITVGNSFVNNTPSQSIAQGDIIYCETTQTGDNVTGLTVTLKIE